jgi:hypothetical protein
MPHAKSMEVSCSPDGAKQDPGAAVPHCASLLAGYDTRRKNVLGNLQEKWNPAFRPKMRQTQKCESGFCFPVSVKPL